MKTCLHCHKRTEYLRACYYTTSNAAIWCATCHHALHITRLLSGKPMIKGDIETSEAEMKAEAKYRGG